MRNRSGEWETLGRVSIVTENDRRAGDVLSVPDLLLRAAMVVTLILVALAFVLAIRPV
jgi:hypothetical protein